MTITAEHFRPDLTPEDWHRSMVAYLEEWVAEHG